MDDIQEINDGSASEHNLKAVESIVMFPFMYIHLTDPKEVNFISLNNLHIRNIHNIIQHLL